jgi:hypothetical protein
MTPGSARPRGSTGNPQARCCVGLGGTPQCAWDPPIDYGDGLYPDLT